MRGVRVAIGVLWVAAACTGDSLPGSAITFRSTIAVMNSTKLKKFSFQLEGTVMGAAAEEWSILFDLYERKQMTDKFSEATMSVKAGVSARNAAKTRETARAGDFSVRQQGHVLTAVAAAAKQLKAGEITQDQFNAVVEATMARR